MLTPSEDQKLKTLLRRKAEYVPMTESEINQAEIVCNKTAENVMADMLLCSEPWLRMCGRIQQTALLNTRLLMEIGYLKELVNGVGKSK